MLRKSLVLTLLILYFLSGLVAVISAHERETPHCHWTSGYEFGQHHAEMAQNGHLGADQNPGQHQGYSGCFP